MAAMTFPRVRNRRRTRSIVMASITAVVVAAALMAVVVVLASNRPDQANLGSQIFRPGRADRLAKVVERDGPVLFKDPLTSQPGRELYLQHTGTDVKKGWSAVEAYAIGSPRELRCILTWDKAAKAFDKPCGGDGLVTYPGTVTSNGIVEIDLRTASEAPTS
jgi:hypothetical protein